jgi:hypothetical protein
VQTNLSQNSANCFTYTQYIMYLYNNSIQFNHCKYTYVESKSTHKNKNNRGGIVFSIHNWGCIAVHASKNCTISK